MRNSNQEGNVSNHKIVQLKVENLKKIKAVHITPEGNLVVVGGKNAAGKTSVLDSISMALGGKGEVPGEPIRQGEERGEVVVDLGDLVVRRVFTAKGSRVTVEAQNGAVFPSPQAILDEMTGRLTFDPLEFSRMKETKQAETLRDLAGLDFGSADQARAEFFTERTAVNRELKAMGARVMATKWHEDAPDEEVSVSELMANLSEATKKNKENEAEQTKLTTLIDDVSICKREKVILQEKIEELQGQVDQVTKRQEEFRAKWADQEKKCNALTDINTAAITERISSAEGINAKVRENAARRRLKSEMESVAAQADKLTAGIEKIDADKAAQIAKAKLPIDGLGLSDTGVTFGGLPFDQCSSAEQLRISVAMGIALNPKLRVMLVRDGSLLDEDSLKLLEEMAVEADQQIWLERCGEGEECQVIIENGEVKETT